MISIVYDVKKYRELLAERVSEGDTVIEMGPHTGESTAGYVGKTQLTVALDIAEQSTPYFEKLKEKNSNLRFIRADARKFDAVKQVLAITPSCDLLAVDLGGGRYPDTVFKVWALWSGIFKPRDSIIRCRGLAEFIQRAKIEDASIVQDFEDAGWLSDYGRDTPTKLRSQLDEFSLYIDLDKREKEKLEKSNKD